MFLDCKAKVRMSKYPGAPPGIISKRKMKTMNSNSNASNSLATVAQPVEDAIRSAFEETYAKEPNRCVHGPVSKGAKPLKIPEGLQKQIKPNHESDRSMNIIFGQKFAKLKAISQSEHTARGNAQVSPRVRRMNAQTCKMNENDDCTQMITEQSTVFTKGDRDFQPSINEHLDMLSPTDNDENIHCENDSQISEAIDESVTDTETSESHANAKCSNHADCANPGMERRHSEKYDASYEYGTSLDRNTPKRSVLKSRLAMSITNGN